LGERTKLNSYNSPLVSSKIPFLASKDNPIKNLPMQQMKSINGLSVIATNVKENVVKSCAFKLKDDKAF
jgi:hypothetical protein